MKSENQIVKKTIHASLGLVKNHIGFLFLKKMGNIFSANVIAGNSEEVSLRQLHDLYFLLWLGLRSEMG